MVSYNLGFGMGLFFLSVLLKDVLLSVRLLLRLLMLLMLVSPLMLAGFSFLAVMLMYPGLMVLPLFSFPSYLEQRLMIFSSFLMSPDSLSSSMTDFLLTRVAAMLLLPKYSFKNLKQSSQLIHPSWSASTVWKQRLTSSSGGTKSMQERAYLMVFMNSYWSMILFDPCLYVFFLCNLWMAISPKCCSMQKLTSSSYSMMPSLLQSYLNTFFTKQCISGYVYCRTVSKNYLISYSWNCSSLLASKAITFMQTTSRTQKARMQEANQNRCCLMVFCSHLGRAFSFSRRVDISGRSLAQLQGRQAPSDINHSLSSKLKNGVIIFKESVGAVEACEGRPQLGQQQENKHSSDHPLSCLVYDWIVNC